MKISKKISLLLILSLLIIMLAGCKKDNTANDTSNSQENVSTQTNGTNENQEEVSLPITFDIDKDTYKNTESLTLKINNLSNYNINTTSAYKIEKHKNNKWEEVSLGKEFSTNTMKVQYIFEQVVDLSKLEKGDYKISKEINYNLSEKDEEPSVLILEKEFKIE